MKTFFVTSAYVLRTSLGDCTAGGVSAARNTLTCYYKNERDNDGDADGFTLAEARFLAATLSDFDIIIVEDICCGTRRLRAIPVEHILSGAWTMFGGNFLYSGDSRFFEHPIKIHDRIEK